MKVVSLPDESGSKAILREVSFPCLCFRFGRQGGPQTDSNLTASLEEV